MKNNKVKIVRARLNEMSYKALEDLCNKKGLTISKALREAIKDWYSKNK